MTTVGRSRVEPPTSAPVPMAPLLRLDEVAGLLSVSRSFAYQLVASGVLRSVRLGRAVRVRPSDLEAYIADPARER